MGKQGGFLEYSRKDPAYRPLDERVKDFRAVEIPLTADDIHIQAARCMECGTPFCYGYGCPLANIIPELNDLVYQDRWREALDLLVSTNPFPEFTGRLCPALCEASCVLAIHDDPVTIRQLELAIIEKGYAEGYLRPAVPSRRFEESIAVIGSGPAGLAAAHALNQAGYRVVVYESAAKAGGILRYGIPDFKLEKWVLDRRLQLMEQEGIRFETGVTIGPDLSYRYLRNRFQAVCLCGGVWEPRDLRIPGRDLTGIYFAMQYLISQNRKNAGEAADAATDIDAGGKRVVIIGGGDTGADCLGTAIRQGARSILQLEILPEPSPVRPDTTPWPMWPSIRRDATSHKEGGKRQWGVSTTEFHGKNGHVARVGCVEVDSLRHADGHIEFAPRQGSEFEVETDLVLLALGYVTSGRNRLVDDLHIERDRQGNIRTDDGHMTSVRGIFVAGDMLTGQSLVARAMADGLAAARGIMRWLNKGS